MAGEEGFEPSYGGIKIRCLNQLGDSPVVKNLTHGPRNPGSRHPVMERMTVEPSRHESAHPVRQLGVDRDRFGLRRELIEETRSGARHTRLRASLSKPRELRAHLGVLGAHDPFEVVPSLPREKGRYFECFRLPCQRAREDFLRGNTNLRREHEVPRRGQVQRREPLAEAFAQGVLAEDEKWNVGAQPRRNLQELRAIEAEVPFAIEHQEHRRRIGGPAAQAAAYRQVLFQLEVGAKARAGVLLEEPRRPNAQIVLAERSGEADLAILAARNAYAVGAIDEPEDGLQIVEAVGPPG